MEPQIYQDGIFWEHCFILVDYEFFSVRGDEVREWLTEFTPQSRWQGMLIQFEDEESALLFKVTWG